MESMDNRPLCCSIQLEKLPTEQREIKHYSSLHKILLVGEGDFSFANALANAFGVGYAQNIVATSFDSRDKVISQYASAGATLKNLQCVGASVLYCVDATIMCNHELLRNLRFDRIIFNFPHSGFSGGEMEKRVISKHQTLVRSFFENAICLLEPTGEVHVTHKTRPPFSEWKLEEQAAKSGLFMRQSSDFSHFDYPGYINRRGEGVNCGKTFPARLSKTFMFCAQAAKRCV